MDLEKINTFYKDVSYYKQHKELNLEEWQFALRKKYAEKNPFGIEKIGRGGVFSEYIVRNPDRKSAYTVAVRSSDNTRNFCDCFDFKTNRLGTCKHIEAVLNHLRSKPRTAALLGQKYEPEYSSVFLDYRGERKIRLRIGTEKSEAFANFRNKYFSGNGENVLLPEKFSEFNIIRNEAMEISSGFRCYPDALDFILDYRDRQDREERIGNKYGSNDNTSLNSLLRAKLYPFQQEGIRFAGSAGRCLLADDMGLGKTIQGLGVAELLKKEYGIGKVLIICPTSLKYQWKSEIEKFTGSSVRVIEGLPHKRYEQYRGDEFYKIVSYHMASNDVMEISSGFPDFIILDEAQRIKNFLTKTARNIKRIPSTYAIVLTGTPLENKLEELYSVTQFLDPFILGPYHEFLARHQVKSESGKITGYRDLNAIGEKLSGMMLRRKKSEVLLQLPGRMDKMLLVSMTEKQLEFHEEFKSIVATLVHKWRRLGFLPEKDRLRLMINLNMMRMVCDSTFILDQESRHDTKIDELMNILQEIFSEGDEKVVVFSQWERMTRIVAGELDELGVGYEYLHGGVPGVKRKALLDNFNNDPDKRVFLSTDAGGTGLNLQSASYMVNLDIPWNPAVLEQRIGRIHRIGQKKKVSVINMVSAGTIEHRMTEVLKFKSSLAEGVLDKGEDVIFMGESKFNKLMNTVEGIMPDTTAVPADETVEEKHLVVEDDNILEKESSQELTEPSTLFEEEKDRVPVFAGETSKETQVITDPQVLIKNGLNFFTGLTKILGNPEATRKLVSTIVARDEKDGKTYLKLPVESEKAVENVLGLIGNLMKNLN